MFHSSETLQSVLVAATLLASTGVSAQETQWQKDHPRRAEVKLPPVLQS